jgi:hypothetical protein
MPTCDSLSPVPNIFLSRSLIFCSKLGILLGLYGSGGMPAGLHLPLSCLDSKATVHL